MNDWDMDDEVRANPMDQLAEAEEEMKKELSRPLTQKDCPDMTQIQIDCINVQEKRVELSSFPQDYQQQIKNYYRFAPLNVESQNATAAKGGRSSWK
jgi:hypothetical protein